jgi:hypothetical protein
MSFFQLRDMQAEKNYFVFNFCRVKKKSKTSAKKYAMHKKLLQHSPRRILVSSVVYFLVI